MIVKDFKTIGQHQFVETYSDKYLMIERDGIKYSSATDLAGQGNEYTETNERIFKQEDYEHLPIDLKAKVLAAYAELDSEAH